MQFATLTHRPLRAIYVVFAITLLMVGLVPAFIHQASAAQLTSRSIQMSDSTEGATNVSYNVSFNFITTGNTGGIVVDFCDNDPIIGDTSCSTPAGFSLTATPTVTNQSTTAGCSLATFTNAGELNSDRTLTLTAASPVNFTGSPCAGSFTITSVTNPTTSDHSFYARIYTYASAAGATGYTVASPGAYLDAGGVALSTASNINVTARVQEQLSFCVYTGTCGTAPNITLGNTQGVLSSSGPFVDKNTNYNIQTNASQAASVNIYGNTLTSGANTIAAMTSAGTISAPGNSQFGLCTYESAGSTLTANANYSGTNGAHVCSGTTQTAGTGSTGGDNTCYFYFGTQAQSQYGDTIASDSAGSTATGVIAFLGNVSNSQTAGVYTTNLKLIATGKF